MSYLQFIFDRTSESGKTKVWRVTSSGNNLGMICWYSHWRKYVFAPAPSECIFDAGCLEEISVFLKAQMLAHKEEK